MENCLSDQVAGTCYAVGSALIFACIALVVTVDMLPVLLATEVRFLVCWVMAVLFMLYFKVSRGLHWFGPPELRKLVFLKVVLAFTWVTLWWSALRQAPMGDCIAIVYSGPILTSLWSAIFLGENIPQLFIVQALLVTSGILLIIYAPFLRVGSAMETGNHANYTYVLMGLLVNSFVPVLTRQTRACSWIEVAHVCTFSAGLVFNPCLLLASYVFDGTFPPLPQDAMVQAGLIAAAGLGTFVAVAMETQGYQLAEPGKAAIFRYIEVPFAYFLQHVGTSTPVTSSAILGAIMITASCLIGVMEHRRAQQKEAREALLSKSSTNGMAQ